MLQPIKVAFGQYMSRFYASLLPTTKQLNEYKARGLDKSIVWAPSRMVDVVEDMLAAWQKNDTYGADTQPAKMPVIVVAVDENYAPSGRDYTRQISEMPYFTLPGVEKERAFKIRVIAADIRAQVVIMAHEEPTAKSIASQFCLFLDSIENRRFQSLWSFAGESGMEWPVQIESPEVPAMSIKTDAKNLTILACDVTLKASIPLFYAPGVGEPNDGQGTPGTNDPAGYPVVLEVNSIRKDTL